MEWTMKLIMALEEPVPVLAAGYVFNPLSPD